MEGQIGAVRAGYLADLIVVNGNPLENMKVCCIHQKARESNGQSKTESLTTRRHSPARARAGTKSPGTELHAENLLLIGSAVNPGGHAAAFSSAGFWDRNVGYQRRNISSNSPFKTRVRVCSNR